MNVLNYVNSKRSTLSQVDSHFGVFNEQKFVNKTRLFSKQNKQIFKPTENVGSKITKIDKEKLKR